MSLKYVGAYLEKYCPLMEGNKFREGIFGAAPVAYRLEEMPAESIVKQYTDGGSMKQILFRLIPEIPKDYNMQCGQKTPFFSLLSEWAASAKVPASLEECRLVRLEVLKDGAVFRNGTKEAFYYLQCRFLYRCSAQQGMEGPLVARKENVAFYQINAEANFCRMEEFTQLFTDKHAKVEAREGICSVRFRPVIQYCFDQFRDNAVHSDIVDIHTKERPGEAEKRKIVTVNFTQLIGEDAYAASMHTFAVVPGSEGEALRTCRYTGSFYALDAVSYGKATSDDGWKTCTFLQTDHI